MQQEKVPIDARNRDRGVTTMVKTRIHMVHG